MKVAAAVYGARTARRAESLPWRSTTAGEPPGVAGAPAEPPGEQRWFLA